MIDKIGFANGLDSNDFLTRFRKLISEQLWLSQYSKSISSVGSAAYLHFYITTVVVQGSMLHRQQREARYPALLYFFIAHKSTTRSTRSVFVPRP